MAIRKLSTSGIKTGNKTSKLSSDTITIEYLIIAGGGAGGGGIGGGGGAGGYITSSAYPVTVGTSYTITCGAGGS